MACCLKQEWNHQQPVLCTQPWFVSTIFALDALTSGTFLFPRRWSQATMRGQMPTEPDLAEAGASLLLSTRRGFYQGVSVDHLQLLGGNSNSVGPSQAVYEVGTDLSSQVMRLEYRKVGHFSPCLQTCFRSHSRSSVELKLVLWLLDAQFRVLLIQSPCSLIHKWT